MSVLELWEVEWGLECGASTPALDWVPPSAPGPAEPLALTNPQVLMAELLPLLREQEPLGRPWLALCRAAHCLLCEGGQHFLTVLQDEPADRLSPP